jgi:hypothetical protein
MAKSRNTSDSNFESHALQFQTAVEHVWPQLVLAWLMCLLSNVIYWLVKGYNMAAVDVVDDSNYDGTDALRFHYHPSNAWIPIDVEAMHGIVGQVSRPLRLSFGAPFRNKVIFSFPSLDVRSWAF